MTAKDGKPPGDKRIGDLLVDEGVVRRDVLEELLKRKPQVADRRLVSELYASGLATERQLADVLAKRVGAPVAVLTESVIDVNVLRMVPPDIMRKHFALPVAADDHTITVVTPDPDDPALTVPLGIITGRRVVLLIGIHSVLEQSIEAALAAQKKHDPVLIGKNAAVASPHLEVARYAPAVSLDEANRIARAIITALTDEPAAPSPDWEAPSNTTRIGAIRLKRMLLERPKEAQPLDAAIVEKPLEVLELEDEAPEALRPDALPPDALPPDVAAESPVLPPDIPAELPHGLPHGLPPDDMPAGAPVRSQPLAFVVDDDPAIRALLAKALIHDGLKVLEAEDGEEAIALLRELRPDVVLLDAMLPFVHGFEICSGLKRSEHKDVPVIMISAVYKGWVQAREIQEIHGADHFVEKPFELTFIRRLVAEVLKRPHATHVEGVDPARAQEVRQRYAEHAAAGLWFAAAADVEQWISIDPFDGRAWVERGNLAAQAGDLVNAMAAFEAAAVYAPGLLVAQLGLAMVYEQLGFRRRAQATWRRARDLATDDVARQIDQHIA